MTALAPQPAILALVVPAALLLVWAAGRHPRWPARRTLAGLAGLTALAAASARGLDGRAARLLSVHMLQHAVIQLVAAPLLVASAPLRLALGTLPRAPRRRLARLLHGRLARALSRPLVGLGIFVAALALVHEPAVYDAALRHPLVHAAEHAVLLWSAIALWVPIVGADPLPRRAGPIACVGVLVGAMVAMSALGAGLATLRTVAYPAYAATTPDALADQALAGGVMWVAGMAVVLPALVAVAWSTLWAQERAQRARERVGAPSGGRG
jgi:putative copper resistance protein D